MAVNKPIGDNSRKGAIRNRKQFYNAKTKLWVKINSKTGTIMDVKTSGGKFKGVTRINSNK